MLTGEKLLLTIGAGFTVRVAVARTAFDAPPFTVSAPAAIVLVTVAVAVTETVTVHDPFAGMVAPVRPTSVPPIDPVTLPFAQVLLGADALTMPLG